MIVYCVANAVPLLMGQHQQALSAMTVSNSQWMCREEYNERQPYTSAETVIDGFCLLEPGLSPLLSRENFLPCV